MSGNLRSPTGEGKVWSNMSVCLQACSVPVLVERPSNRAAVSIKAQMEPGGSEVLIEAADGRINYDERHHTHTHTHLIYA